MILLARSFSASQTYKNTERRIGCSVAVYVHKSEVLYESAKDVPSAAALLLS